MLSGLAALIVAALFAGASLYVSMVDQPARLALDDHALLVQWKSALKRGFAMQGTLVILGCLLGIVAWWQTGAWGFPIGAVAMIATGPWTALCIKSINNALLATDPAAASPKTRELVVAWGARHGVRTALGLVAILAFLWACLSG